MKNVGQKAPRLSAGQLWKLGNQFMRIISMENPSVRFKLMDAPDDLDERTLTGDCDTLLRYVQSRNGELVRTGLPARCAAD
jgi:hypothetical protein